MLIKVDTLEKIAPWEIRGESLRGAIEREAPQRSPLPKVKPKVKP